MSKVRLITVSAVGALATLHCLPSIRPGIIRIRHGAPVDVSAFYIDSLICPNGYKKLAMPDADIVRMSAR